MTSGLLLYRVSGSHHVCINHFIFLEVIVTAVHIVCKTLLLISELSKVFFPCYFLIDQHLNILVPADLLAALLMRTLQLVEQMVQRVDSLQIPDWQREESGHNDIEIT